MRIAIDACCWSNRRGFGRFTRELVGHMVAEHPGHEYTLVLDRATAEQSRLPAGVRLEVVATREQPTRAASAAGARSPLDLLRMARAAARVPADLFFFPAVYSYYPMLRRVPTVVTFHDAIAETHPRLIFRSARARLFWRAKSWLANRQADRIVTVSSDARKRIAAALGRRESSIAVVTEGPGADFRPLRDRVTVRHVLEDYDLPADEPLILYVGGISPHKNLDGLLHAFAQLAYMPAHLAIVGDHSGDSFLGCYPELVRLRERLTLQSRVTFTGFVPDAHLAVLYNAATVLVLPSFDEGFGLPAVEAMACGLPVAASRSGSLPEVVGPAGVFFEAGDHAAMAATLRRILDDPDLRAQLSAEGLRRAELFTWGAAARDALRVFEETARQP
ncbi:MAG TPA: glycosyltransferase family 1 protein [Vicinamibacteria bacterium]|nr:glycosyltransferase family 1 protein [Vicinamibacteria bacterium]